MAVANGTVTATTTPQLVRPAGTRINLYTQNQSGSIPVYWGPTSGVTAATGMSLPVIGAYEETHYTGAVYVVTGSSTSTVYWEEL